MLSLRSHFRISDNVEKETSLTHFVPVYYGSINVFCGKRSRRIQLFGKIQSGIYFWIDQYAFPLFFSQPGRDSAEQDFMDVDLFAIHATPIFSLLQSPGEKKRNRFVPKPRGNRA